MKAPLFKFFKALTGEAAQTGADAVGVIDIYLASDAANRK